MFFTVSVIVALIALLVVLYNAHIVGKRYFNAWKDAHS